METTCHASYPLNSENASPFGTFTVYLSCAEIAQPPATTSNNSTATGSLPGPRNTSEKKNDMDALLDRVPTGLRKRFGF